ncbi:hypothetical protein [Gynurincola endophyticus]|uniref:hypothetical protein n=1 Tax=Gynurincola endophyticus TaxID=2479004 RepID=UPI000F8D0EAD|nr:hypothetical protein [Gynurincola endophyticus]
MKEKNTHWLLHLFFRITGIVVLFFIIYNLLLNGRKDPLGYGFLYTCISVILISFVYFLAECIILYRKRRTSTLYVSLLLLLSATGVLCILSIL